MTLSENFLIALRGEEDRGILCARRSSLSAAPLGRRTPLSQLLRSVEERSAALQMLLSMHLFIPGPFPDLLPELRRHQADLAVASWWRALSCSVAITSPTSIRASYSRASSSESLNLRFLLSGKLTAPDPPHFNLRD